MVQIALLRVGDPHTPTQHTHTHTYAHTFPKGPALLLVGYLFGAFYYNVFFSVSASGDFD